jgi:hypothetical protein
MTLTARLQKRLKRFRTLSNKITKENFYGIKTNHNGHNGQFKRITSSSYHHNFYKKEKNCRAEYLRQFSTSSGLKFCTYYLPCFLHSLPEHSTVYLRQLCAPNEYCTSGSVVILLYCSTVYTVQYVYLQQ